MKVIQFKLSGFSVCRQFVALAISLSLTLATQADYFYVTNFTKTGNVQSNLEAAFPSGLFTPTNAFPAPFNFVTNSAGKNFDEIALGTPLVITNIWVSNSIYVHTIMSAYSPIAAPLATIEFIGDNGADQVFTLTGGVELRDFYHGGWQNTIVGPAVKNVFTINNVTGAAGTGNATTGSFGTYLLDEQRFELTNSFYNQRISSIKISNINSSCTPLLLAMTIETGGLRIPVSETFTNLTAKTNWVFKTQNPSSSFSLNGSALTLDASYLNGGSDLYSGTDYGAPRFLQPVNPGLDWLVETKFNFVPANNYQGAGILLADTTGGFTVDGDFNRIAERAYYPNGGGEVIHSVGAYVPFTNTLSYLRLQKIGTNYTGWYSTNGLNWVLNGTTGFTNHFGFLGLFSIRYPWDSVSLDSTPAFSYFNTSIIPPALQVTNLGTNLLLSWPSYANIYTLQESTNLAGSNWTTSPLTPGVTNGSFTVSVSNPKGAKFFRLRYP